MKKRLNTYYLVNLIVYALVALAALMVLVFPVKAVYSKTSIYLIAAGFLLSGIVKAVFRMFVFKGEYKTADEKDIQLYHMAADRALELSDYTIIALIFLFEYLESSGSFAASKGIVLAVFGVFLPKLYKNLLGLLYQSQDKSE